MRLAERPGAEAPRTTSRDVEHVDNSIHVTAEAETHAERLLRAGEQGIGGVDVEIEDVLDIGCHAAPGEPAHVLQRVN